MFCPRFDVKGRYRDSLRQFVILFPTGRKRLGTIPALNINCVIEPQNNNLGWKMFPEVIQSKIPAQNARMNSIPICVNGSV